MMDITLMSPSATVYNGRHEPLTRRAHGADLLVTFKPALAVRPDESARFCVKAPTFGKIDDRIRL
jgi:hypothetical protein